MCVRMCAGTGAKVMPITEQLTDKSVLGKCEAWKVQMFAGAGRAPFMFFEGCKVSQFTHKTM